MCLLTHVIIWDSIDLLKKVKLTLQFGSAVLVHLVNLLIFTNQTINL